MIWSHYCLIMRLAENDVIKTVRTNQPSQTDDPKHCSNDLKLTNFSLRALTHYSKLIYSSSFSCLDDKGGQWEFYKSRNPLFYHLGNEIWWINSVPQNFQFSMFSYLNSYLKDLEGSCNWKGGYDWPNPFSYLIWVVASALKVLTYVV